MKLLYTNKATPKFNIPNITPKIISLSSFYSPAGARNLVIIKGENFNKFSIILFGNITPPVIFISSLQLEFYIPSTITAGEYTIKVINDDLISNGVNYTIDNSSGYWLLDPIYKTISNTNYFGITFKPPIKGMPFFTGTFGSTNNIISNEDTFFTINTSTNSNISISNNEKFSYINFRYTGVYLIQITLSTLVNGFTNYTKLFFNIVSYPDTKNIIQTSFHSGVWNETSCNSSFYVNIIKPNTIITFNSLSNPYNINICELTSGLNRLIISQIG